MSQNSERAAVGRKPPSCAAAAAEGTAEFPVVDVEAGGAGEGDEEVAQVDEPEHPFRERQQLVLGLKCLFEAVYSKKRITECVIITPLRTHHWKC